MSRRDKKYAKRDNEAYPPRIVLTISEIKHLLFRSSVKQLHIKVTGIAEQSSVCQGFNLPILHRIKKGRILHIGSLIKLPKLSHWCTLTETDQSISLQAAVDLTGPGKLING